MTLSMKRKFEIVTGRVRGACVDSVTDAGGMDRFASTLVIGYSLYMVAQLTSKSLRAALRRLGLTLRASASLTLGGSAALLLTGALDRRTDDGDVVESSVDFATLLEAVRKVEVIELAPPGWLNTSIQAYSTCSPRTTIRDSCTSRAWDSSTCRSSVVPQQIALIAVKAPDRAAEMRAILDDVRAARAAHREESAQ